MISRMLSTSPPGVSRRKINTSAFRSSAVSMTFSTCRTVAGPIGPSIAASNAMRRGGAIRHLAPPGARSDKCDCDRERKAAKHRADLHVRLPGAV